MRRTTRTNNQDNPPNPPPRPKKRTLVRWNEDLDEHLLLTVQSVCNNLGIRIPFDKVAETLGNNASEGAIVQHLAKLRTRRVNAGKNVPPPLRRGGNGPGTASGTAGTTDTNATTATTGSKIKSTAAGRKRKADDMDSDDTEVELEDESSDEETPKPRTSRKKAKGVKAESDDEADAEGELAEVSGQAGNTNDMLVPGASFLTYPNAQGQASQDNSLVVHLKYRRDGLTDPFVAGPEGFEAAGPIFSNPENQVARQQYITHTPEAAELMMGNHDFVTSSQGDNAMTTVDQNSLYFMGPADMTDPQLPSRHMGSNGIGWDADIDAYPFSSFQAMLHGVDYPEEMFQGQDQGDQGLGNFEGFEDPTLS